MADHAQCTQGIEMVVPPRTSLKLSHNIVRKSFCFAQRRLRRGRARVSGLCISYRGTITDCPQGGVFWHSKGAINHQRTPLVSCQWK